MSKIKTSFTLTFESLTLLKSIALSKGISMASTIELMIREKAKKENIKIS